MATMDIGSGMTLFGLTNILNEMWRVVNYIANQLYEAVARVWSALSDLAAWVYENFTTAVGQLFSKIGGVVTTIADAVYASVSWISTTVLNAIGSVGGAVIGVLGSIGTIAANLIIAGITDLIMYGSILYEKISKILEVIHLKTILKIHDLLQTLVPQYREMMRGVYGELAKISEAIGLGTHFLTFALRNARNLVLDFSTAIGSSYDMAEIQWLNSMGDFFNKMQGKVDTWQNNPEQVFYDIAQQFDKPTMDSKGSFLGSMWIALDSAVNQIVEISGKVEKITADAQKLLLDLPKFIRDNIPTELYTGIETVRNSIDTYVTPYLSKLDKLVTQYADEARKAREEAQAAFARILSARQVVQQINASTGQERAEAQDAIARLHKEALDASDKYVGDFVGPRLEKLAAGLAMPEPTIAQPSILTFEIDIPSGVEVGPMLAHASPFVGDY